MMPARLGLDGVDVADGRVLRRHRALLVGMAVWEWRAPGGAPRRGVLGIVTTRGDRLFISLLSAAYVHLIWLAFSAAAVGRDAVVGGLAVVVFRYV